MMMMILEVFLVCLLPGDCACAHLRAGEGSCQGGASTLQTPPCVPGCQPGCPVSSLETATLNIGDAVYPQGQGSINLSSLCWEETVKLVLTGILAAPPPDKETLMSPGPAPGGWWGPPQQQVWGLVGAGGFALPLSPKGSEQLEWGGHIWTLQGGGGRSKVPVGGLGGDIWAPCGPWQLIAADGMRSHLLLLERSWEGENAKSG